jgi:hypothetical protein
MSAHNENQGGSDGGDQPPNDDQTNPTGAQALNANGEVVNVGIPIAETDDFIVYMDEDAIQAMDAQQQEEEEEMGDMNDFETFNEEEFAEGDEYHEDGQIISHVSL